MSSPDPDQTMFFSRPEGLARILSLDDESTELWNPLEMKSMWSHQMAALLETDLGSLSTPTPQQAAALAAFPGKTFAELLSHPEPPLPLLESVKEFAKQTLRDCDDKQLKELASVLYYATYAAALTRCGKSLGSLKGPHLVTGFGWALERPWLDQPVRDLLQAALRETSTK